MSQFKPEKIKEEILNYLMAFDGHPKSDESIADHIGAPLYIINRILFDIREAKVPLVESCFENDTACHRFIGDTDDYLAKESIDQTAPDTPEEQSKLPDLEIPLSIIRQHAPIAKGEFQKLSQLSQHQCSKIIDLLVAGNDIIIFQEGRRKMIDIKREEGGARGEAKLSSTDNAEAIKKQRQPKIETVIKDKTKAATHKQIGDTQQLDQVIAEIIGTKSLSQTECIQSVIDSYHTNRLDVVRHLFDMEIRQLVNISENTEDLSIELTSSGLALIGINFTFEADGLDAKIKSIIDAAELKYSDDAMKNLETIDNHIQALSMLNSEYESTIARIKRALKS